MNLLNRIKAETPPFFKKLRALSLIITAIATSLLTSQSLISGFVLPDMIKNIATYCIIGGIAIAATSTTAAVTPVAAIPEATT